MIKHNIFQINDSKTDLKNNNKITINRFFPAKYNNPCTCFTTMYSDKDLFSGQTILLIWPVDLLINSIIPISILHTLHEIIHK